MKRFSLALFLMMASAPAQAAPSGPLAYIRDLKPWLEPQVGRPPRELPHRGSVYRLAVSPTTGEVASLEALVGRNSPELPPLRGVRLSPPYKAPQLLPAPWNGVRPGWLFWSEDGHTLRSENWNGRPLVWTAAGTSPAPWPDASTSADGRVVARATGNGLVYAVGGAKERAVFTPGRPQALLDALNAQRHRPGVAAFLRGYDPALARDRNNWRFSLPAVSPDGQAVYFAANLGQGDDDMHNNFNFSLYRVDTRGGALLALGHFGEQDGETPTLRVSPNGRRLLVVQRIFLSAVLRPVTLTALDLATGAARDLTVTDRGPGDTNDLSGFCWLADSRHVAYSV